MLFKKNLQSILAPLENIHNHLNTFMEEAAQEIADNIKKIVDIQAVNELKKEEQDQALKVKENLKMLLGKL